MYVTVAKSLWRMHSARHSSQSVIHSVMEYGVEALGPQMTADQSEELESVQRMALKMIYGYDLKYSLIRQVNNIQTLAERRSTRIRKFAKKLANEKKVAHWFPPPLQSQTRDSLRTAVTVQEDLARTTRLYSQTYCSI